MWSLNANTLLLLSYIIYVCYGESPPLGKIHNIFEALGYSPSCVATALVKCAMDKQTIPLANISKESTGSQDTILNEQLQNYPRNCADLQAAGETTSGVRTVYPYFCCPSRPVSVFCDQTTDEGGWTVLQRRDALPYREDFERTWIEYALGFGNLTGEFWLGLDNIHALVSSNLMELRVDLETFEGEKGWAKFGIFHVGNSESKYILNIGRYSGDAGDSLSIHNGFMFSTHDADHDTSSSENCAKKYRGAWWHLSCHNSNLNGFQYEGAHSSHADGINWHAYKGLSYSLKKTVMGFRPKYVNR